MEKVIFGKVIIWALVSELLIKKKGNLELLKKVWYAAELNDFFKWDNTFTFNHKMMNHLQNNSWNREKNEVSLKSWMNIPTQKNFKNN
jgi:hypothetical protein